jgi:Flp pilus assembly CpaE family ATPase
MKWTRQLLVYADDVNILEESVHTIKKTAEVLEVVSKEIDWSRGKY